MAPAAERTDAASSSRLTSLEICAGAGGLALGLEEAGFDPVLLLDSRAVACETLRANRPHWDVREIDIAEFDPVDDQQVYDVQLLSGGLPRVKSSAAATRTRGDDAELAVLGAAVDLIYGVQPRAVLLENVPDLARKAEYQSIREFIGEELDHLGYGWQWHVLNAKDYGVPQHREVGFLVAFKDGLIDRFEWPEPRPGPPPTVGETLRDSMRVRGWPDSGEWADQAGTPAPTIVGGSWERGGADLGPTGAKRKWALMGVDGGTVADRVPGADFVWDPATGRSGCVALTVEQVALLQGFPAVWRIVGRKTARYRQVGNATPPPLARAVGAAIASALRAGDEQ